MTPIPPCSDSVYLNSIEHSIEQRDIYSFSQNLLLCKSFAPEAYQAVLQRSWYLCLQTEYIEGLSTLELAGLDLRKMDLCLGAVWVDEVSDTLKDCLDMVIDRQRVKLKELVEYCEKVILDPALSEGDRRKIINTFSRLYFDGGHEYRTSAGIVINSISTLFMSWMVMRKKSSKLLFDEERALVMTQCALSLGYIDLSHFVKHIDVRWIEPIFQHLPEIAKKFIDNPAITGEMPPELQVEIGNCIKSYKLNYDTNIKSICLILFANLKAAIVELVDSNEDINAQTIRKKYPHIPNYIKGMVHSEAYFRSYLPNLISQICGLPIHVGNLDSLTLIEPGSRLNLITTVLEMSEINWYRSCISRTLDETQSKLQRYLRQNAERYVKTHHTPSAKLPKISLIADKTLPLVQIAYQESLSVFERLKAYRESHWGTYQDGRGQRVQDEHSSEKAAKRAYSHLENTVYPTYFSNIKSFYPEFSDLSEAEIIDCLNRRYILRIIQEHGREVGNPDTVGVFMEAMDQSFSSFLEAVKVSVHDRALYRTLREYVSDVFNDYENIYVLALRTLLNCDNYSYSFFVKHDHLNPGSPIVPINTPAEVTGSSSDGEGYNEEDDEEGDDSDSEQEQYADAQLPHDLIQPLRPELQVYVGRMMSSGQLQQGDAEEVVRKIVAVIYTIIDKQTGLNITEQEKMFFYLASSIAEIGQAYAGSASSNACLPGHVSILTLGVLNRHPDKKLHIPAFRDEAIIEVGSRVVAKIIGEKMGASKKWAIDLLEGVAAIDHTSEWVIEDELDSGMSPREKGLEALQSGREIQSLVTGNLITYTTRHAEIKFRVATYLSRMKEQVIRSINEEIGLPEGLDSEGPVADATDKEAINYLFYNLGNSLTRTCLMEEYLKRFKEEPDPEIYLPLCTKFLWDTEHTLRVEIAKKYPACIPNRDHRIEQRVMSSLKISQIKSETYLYVLLRMIREGVHPKLRLKILHSLSDALDKISISDDVKSLDLLAKPVATEEPPLLHEVACDDATLPSGNQSVWDAYVSVGVDLSGVRDSEYLSNFNYQAYSPYVDKALQITRQFWLMYREEVLTGYDRLSKLEHKVKAQNELEIILAGYIRSLGSPLDHRHDLIHPTVFFANIIPNINVFLDPTDTFVSYVKCQMADFSVPFEKLFVFSEVFQRIGNLLDSFVLHCVGQDVWNISGTQRTCVKTQILIEVYDKYKDQMNDNWYQYFEFISHFPDMYANVFERHLLILQKNIPALCDKGPCFTKEKLAEFLVSVSARAFLQLELDVCVNAFGPIRKDRAKELLVKYFHMYVDGVDRLLDLSYSDRSKLVNVFLFILDTPDYPQTPFHFFKKLFMRLNENFSNRDLYKNHNFTVSADKIMTELVKAQNYVFSMIVILESAYNFASGVVKRITFPRVPAVRPASEATYLGAQSGGMSTFSPGFARERASVPTLRRREGRGAFSRVTQSENEGQEGVVSRGGHSVAGP